MNTKSIAAVMQEELPPLRYIVDELLPQGLAILAGLPKIGKSYLSLDLCLCVAHGLPFLGKRTHAGSVLYLALEDSDRRLQKRVREVWGDKAVNSKFHRVTKAPRTNEGLLLQLDEHMAQYPDTSLIVIDTLQKVRKNTGQGGAYYGTDYDDADEFKDFADKYNICVLIIHHFRKMDDNGDVFNRISGTTGLTGSADTLLALHKGKRFDNEAILSVTSRDSQDIELTLTKDTTNGVRWKNLGTTEEIEANRKQEAYTNSRIRQAVLQLLAEQNSWIGTMSQFMEGHSWNIQSNHLSRELKQFQVNMRLLDSIEYIPPTKSSRLHQFKRI